MQSWFFLVVSLAFNEEFQRVNDLRQLLEKRMACALQIAKQPDYSPKHGLSGPPRQPETFTPPTVDTPKPAAFKVRASVCAEGWHP
jgi:hypothetical protein